MARKKRGRSLSGVLLFDKPSGLSSNKALQQVRHLYFANKAGHTGSLDPMATGLLPICFGEATKFSQFLLESDKSYQATVVLGLTSDTADRDGDIELGKSVESLNEHLVLAALEKFKGHQKQVPPMYSALKVDGQRLYKLARQGVEVEREARDVEIKRLELKSFAVTSLAELDLDLGDLAGEVDEQTQFIQLQLDMDVSKGTYVRSIAEDLGRELGVGGMLVQLRRTAVSGFDVSDATDIDRLRELEAEADRADYQSFQSMDDRLLPIDVLMPQFAAVELDENSSHYFRQGNPVQKSLVDLSDDDLAKPIKVYCKRLGFIGVAEVNRDGLVAPKRVVVFDT